MTRQNRLAEAYQSLKTATKQAPGMLAAQRQLGDLYSKITPLHDSRGFGPTISEFESTQESLNPVPGNNTTAEPIFDTKGQIGGATQALNSSHRQAGLPITIVTGLPRSGTSLAMQLLMVSGHELLFDDNRQADP